MAIDDLDSRSDEELLQSFRSGNAQAFAELLRRYRTPIYNYILRSVRHPERAEDLMQDVFMKVIRHQDGFRGHAKFSTWLYTIARNRCIDFSRKMSHRRHRSLDAPAYASEDQSTTLVEQVPAADLGADRQVVSSELRTRIADAVESLPDDQREVFLMRQVGRRPYKEIAEIVGVSENTIKSRMRYALERLQKSLEEYEEFAKRLT